MANQKPREEVVISFEKLRKITENPDSRIHFVGIGGVSMYSLARLAMLGKAKVSGSDREESKRTEELSSLGADIKIGHSAENVNGASVVVYTHAISKDNIELTTAVKLGIPTVTRAEYR